MLPSMAGHFLMKCHLSGQAIPRFPSKLARFAKTLVLIPTPNELSRGPLMVTGESK